MELDVVVPNKITANKISRKNEEEQSAFVKIFLICRNVDRLEADNDS